MSPGMSLATRVALGHAVVHCIAEAEGVRLLHIKGPALDPALTPGRVSHDVDVLVEPADAKRFIEALITHGWTLAYDFTDGSAFEHAATLTHPLWLSVDVHRLFPGIGTDPGSAFESMWRGRHLTAIAGVPCAVPSIATQRLILVLHALRARQPDDPDLVRAWGAATPAERGQVDAVARELGAFVPLAVATGRADLVRTQRGFRLWQAMTAADPSNVSLLIGHVRAAPSLREGLSTGLRLVRVRPGRVEQDLGHAPSRAERLRGDTSRVARALHSSVRRGIRRLRARTAGRGPS